MQRIAASAFIALCPNGAALGDDGASRPRPDSEPCRADAQRLCPGIPPGGGRILDCLKEHRNDVASACQAMLKAMAERRDARRRPGSDGNDSDDGR